MTESEFIALTDAVLDLVGQTLDDSNTDLDWQANDGILEIDCDDDDGAGSGGKIILNRHLPNRELWLATRNGGYHYKVAGKQWEDTRSGCPLQLELERALNVQGGVSISMPSLPV